MIGLLSILSMKTHYSPQGDAALEGAATLDYPRQLFTGHTDSILGVAFSPDGKYVLTAGGDDTARLWDVQTGAEIRRFTGHTGAVISVAFSPDGQYALTASQDHTARLWDVQTGAEIRRFTGHTDEVWGVAFSPDGKYVLTGSNDKTARLWDVQTGAEIRRFTGHDRQSVWCGFLARRQICTHRRHRRQDGAIVGCRHRTGVAPIHRRKRHRPGYLFARRQVCPRQQLGQDSMAVGHANGPASAAVSSDTMTSTKAVAFSPDGETVLTSSDDGTARLWDVHTGQEIRRLIGHTSAVYAAAYSPDGRYLVTAGVDKIALLWDAHVQRGLPQFIGHTDTINAHDVAFSPDGKTVLTGSFDKTARLWDALTGAEIRRFIGHTDHVTSVGFSPDGKYVLTASDDKTARLWDAQPGRNCANLAGLERAWLAWSSRPTANI